MADADAELIREIDAFIREAGVSPSAFGQAALGDPGLVFQLKDRKKPRSPSGRTAKRIRDYIRAERKKVRASRRRASGKFNAEEGEPSTA